MQFACLIISHDDTMISSTTADDYKTTPAVDKPTLTQAYLLRNENPPSANLKPPLKSSESSAFNVMLAEEQKRK